MYLCNKYQSWTDYSTMMNNFNRYTEWYKNITCYQPTAQVQAAEKFENVHSGKGISKGAVKTKLNLSEENVFSQNTTNEEYRTFIKQTILHKLERRKKDMKKGEYQYVIQDDKILRREAAKTLYGEQNADNILGMEAKIEKNFNNYCDNFNPQIIEVCFSKKTTVK